MDRQFNIEIITKKPKKIWGLLSHEGRLTIGDFQEIFAMPLNNWKVDDYKQQWRKGLERIKKHSTSCLVTVVQNLHTQYPLIEIWSLYKEDDIIYIHNLLLIDETVKDDKIKLTEFNSKNCYEFVGERITKTEEGTPVSEWSISIHDIEPFLESLNSEIMDHV